MEFNAGYIWNYSIKQHKKFYKIELFVINYTRYKLQTTKQ